MPTNPYDRRNQRQPDGEMSADLRGYLTATTGMAPEGLEIQDLHAMAESARRRGEMAEYDRLVDEHAEEMQSACREAWKQGRLVGVDEGRADFLERFGAHMPRVRTSVEMADATLQGLRIDSRKVTKQQLQGVVHDLHEQLVELVDGYRQGFPRGRS